MQNDKSAPEPPPPAYPGPLPSYPAPHGQPGVSMYTPGPNQYTSGYAVPAQRTTTFPGNPLTYGTVPFQSQPTAAPAVTWMPAPPIPPKCPPGLEYLTQLDQIVVHQQIEILELVSGYETCNRYEVKTPMGQWIYFAAEENDDYNLNCYGSLRSFTIKLFDSANQPVMQVSREMHCSICCCPCICCLQELEVQAPLGTVIGYINQKWHPCLPKFAIQNEAREDVLKMAGPCAPCKCYQDIYFEVTTQDETSTIGNICKQWTGMAREATGISNFEINFPLDLDVKMKALILGSAFLLDFMFFEQRRRRQEDS